MSQPISKIGGRSRRAWALGLLMALGWSARLLAQAAPTPESVEFFEKRIRPILSENCFKCHSSTSEKLKGGLMLDSREAMLKGGDTGPAIIAGQTDKSLLVSSIRWEDKDLQMPPKKRLAPSQVEALEAWIKAGAIWPKETAKSGTKKIFDLSQRKKEHWCWNALIKSEPPEVQAQTWPQGSIDRYLLAGLEAKGLKPAPPADKQTLLRRASFDLTGLPPSPADREAFLADNSPTAFEKVVDRLLASPQFGERWARHWLDLVRYAETRGHEFDPDIPNAWQYRDYVVRAFNADLPYNRFVSEQIAGDLIAPRLDKSGANEALLGTGFWFLGEEVHSPVDIRQDEADRMDNRLDVLSKSFLGITIACARCHDHKFDAISQRDYYALSGFLISSRYRQARFQTEQAHRLIAKELDELRGNSRALALKASAAALQPGLKQLAPRLLAAAEVIRGADANTIASNRGLLKDGFTPWVDELTRAKTDPKHLLHPFAKALLLDPAAPPATFAKALFFTPAPATPHSELKVVVDYAKPSPTTWIEDGWVFGLAPVPAGTPLFGADLLHPLLGIATRTAARRDLIWNGLATFEAKADFAKLGTWDRAGRTLQTPEVTLSEPKLWYLVRGSGRAYAAVNSHLVINGPLHGALLKEWKATDQGWHWIEHSLPSYQGHRFHVEFCPMDSSELEIAQVVQSSERPTLESENELATKALEQSSFENPAQLAEAIENLLSKVCTRLATDQIGSGPDSDGLAVWADWLLKNIDLFCPPGSPTRQEFATALTPFITAQTSLTQRIQTRSQTAPAIMDGNGVNEFLLVRGAAKSPGAQIPRRFLEAISGPEPLIAEGSGRQVLAEQIIAPSNPLTARVIVNRVWHHLFGRGIVPTVDNFGVLGQGPSNQALLDYLAERFMTDQHWSLKKLIREVMLSRAYQMSSRPADSVAEQNDPENALVHRMNLRRLEGEAIRDEILSVSGRLDLKAGGPSVPTYLTSFMDGRGKPSVSGPLDGDGRRSLYLSVRRNFLSPMMLAFDSPIPFTAMGRRNISNVPAQALILMNDPFVVAQAKVLAASLPVSATTAERIEQIYLRAFCRLPRPDESSNATSFIQEQTALYGSGQPDERSWADLVHVVFNVKEFIYLH